LKGLRRLGGGLRDVVGAVLAQGLGAYDNPLERCHAQLPDPEDLPAATALGEELLRTAAANGQVLLTPAGGLEIPVRVMLQRTLPGLAVRYLAPDAALGEADLVLALEPGAACPAGAPVARLADPQRLRVTQVFQALQYVESRPYSKLLAEYVAFDT